MKLASRNPLLRFRVVIFVRTCRIYRREGAVAAATATLRFAFLVVTLINAPCSIEVSPPAGACLLRVAIELEEPAQIGQ